MRQNRKPSKSDRYYFIALLRLSDYKTHKYVENISQETSSYKKTPFKIYFKIREEKTLFRNQTFSKWNSSFTIASYWINFKWGWCYLLDKCRSCRSRFSKIFVKKKIWFGRNWRMWSRIISELLDTITER